MRVVDFEGKPQLEIHQHVGCALDDTTWSTDGRRILFDFTDRKTSGLHHALENIQTINHESGHGRTGRFQPRGSPSG